MGLFSRNSSANVNAAVAIPPQGPGIDANGKANGAGDDIVQPPVVTPVLEKRVQLAVAPAIIVPQPPSERQVYLTQMKVRIHQQLVERLDMQNLKSLPP